MTSLVEIDEFTPNIYQLEIADAPEGGLTGIDNVQPRQLANRTLWLKNRLAEHSAALDPHPQYMTVSESDAAINDAVAALVAASPSALDTLNELAAALGNDPNFATTMVTALSTKLTQTQGDARYALASSARTVGEIFTHLGNTAPAGSLAVPIAATSISRAAYASLNLFCADLGYPWGAGDGVTTFGMPFVAADETLVQANGNVRTVTAGQEKDHYHGLSNVPGSGVYGQIQISNNTPGSAFRTGGSATGGPKNLAAGVRVLLCVQYQ